MEQREHDDLLVVSGPSTRREADDLEKRGELHGDVERRTTRKQAAALDEEQDERGDGGEVPEGRTPLPGFGDEYGGGQADDEGEVGPRAERGGADDGEDPQRREGVRHHAVDETEPHWAASGTAASGAGTASTSAR